MLGRTQTEYVSPFGTYGTVAVHVRIHLPSTRTSHVPHSPLRHLYLMNWPACDATSPSGWPNMAIVLAVSLPCVNSTGIVPVSPTAAAPLS
eukprot:4832100-Prymnesium_polylepis.1